MGGGSSSPLCAHCGNELPAGTRFCRICGQSVAGPDADPLTAPLDLPAGGLHPRDTAQDTVTAAAFPSYPADPPGPPPADQQSTDWQPPAYQPGAYEPAAYEPAAYPPSAYEPADYQPGAHRPAGYQPSAYEQPGVYEPAAYQPGAYQPADYQPGAHQSAGYQPGYEQPGGYEPAGYQPRADQPAGYQPGGYEARDQPGGYPPTEYRPGGYQAPDRQPRGYEPGGYPPPGHRSPSGGGSRRGRILIGALAVIVAVGGVAAGLLLARAHSSPGHLAGSGQSTAARHSSPAAVSSSVAVAPTSPPASATASSPQEGAHNLAALLSQSVSDRSAINNAYTDVQNCGPTLAQDQATFQQAVASRQSLLSRLGSMPGASALPATMISSLTQAWQASISADQDYAAWAKDESAGCTPGGSDANLAAAAGPGNQATQNKIAFVNSWNPIAQQYGLPTYSQDQL